MVHCSNQGGKVVPGGPLEAAERFMMRWHEGEAQLSRQRRASAVGGAKGMGGEGGAALQEGWIETRPRKGRVTRGVEGKTAVGV